MEIKKVKPSLWLLLIPVIVSAGLIVLIVLSIGSIGNAFAPMIEINSPGDFGLLEEAGTYYIYKHNTSYGDFEPDQIAIFDQNGSNIPFKYAGGNATMTINNRDYKLVGSFEITTPGIYGFSTNTVPLSISRNSVGGMIGSVFALVGSILGFVFFNLLFLIILFVSRARNRRRLQAEAYGQSGSYPGGYNYNPYYGGPNYPRY